MRVRVSLPGGEGLQVVVGHVQHSEVCVTGEQRHTLVGQVVVGQVELLQDAVTLLRQARGGQALQLIGRRIQAP